MFATTARYSVPLAGATDLELHLTFVASAAGDPASGVVTPTPMTYRCGDETFKVAFEAERAYVTLSDRSLIILTFLEGNSDRDERKTFTNGRLTFVQEREGASVPGVLFARGRMALRPFTSAEGAKQHERESGLVLHMRSPSTFTR